MNSIDANSTIFRSGSTFLIGGPSGVGKSTWVLKFLKHNDVLMAEKPGSILYCFNRYTSYVPALEKFGVQTMQGVPSDEVLDKQPKPFLLILDDLQNVVDPKWLIDIYAVRAHHQNFSVITIVQNIFLPFLKDVRQNTNYIVLMRAPSSALQIKTLGAQLFAKKDFWSAFEDATKEKFGYLLIDNSPQCPPEIRLRTRIFPGEVTVVYQL